MTDLYDMIRAGHTNCEIYEQDANYIKYNNMIEQVRQECRYEEHRGKIRKELKVIYIWGKTGVGKTRGVLDAHCINDVYRVTDYDHPFDAYRGEPVLVFDEFRSQLRISDMLNYLDIYPIKLPSRYVNKPACYTTVYIVSNEPLNEQYSKVQYSQPDTWAAFIRRIHHLFEYTADGRHDRDIQTHLRLRQGMMLSRCRWGGKEGLDGVQMAYKSENREDRENEIPPKP